MLQALKALQAAGVGAAAVAAPLGAEDDGAEMLQGAGALRRQMRGQQLSHEPDPEAEEPDPEAEEPDPEAEEPAVAIRAGRPQQQQQRRPTAAQRKAKEQRVREQRMAQAKAKRAEAGAVRGPRLQFGTPQLL